MIGFEVVVRSARPLLLGSVLKLRKRPPMIAREFLKNPADCERIRQSERDRFRDPALVDRVLELYSTRNTVDFKCAALKRQLNAIQKTIGLVRSGKMAAVSLNTQADSASAKEQNAPTLDRCTVSAGAPSLEALEADRKALLAQAEALSAQYTTVNAEFEAAFATIGNILDPAVPVARDEAGNATVRTFTAARPLAVAQPRTYADLMEHATNAAAGASVIGHRGYYLEGPLAHLARALKSYAIDFLAARGYTYIQPPVMMRQEVMGKTAQLSDFDEQLYKVEGGQYLIATAEQPLTALFMNRTLTADELPQRFAGESLCFRKEAGAYGKDNAGIFRVHQFEKIEQFVVCAPGESAECLEQMIAACEAFYQSLDISYQLVRIASGEMNDAAAMKYDLEALFPSSGRFRELVSASNCTDYQSRSLDALYGYRNSGEARQYVHMLNATMCAVQRTLCCVVENYQEEGRIAVPAVLQKYTGFAHIDIPGAGSAGN